MSEKPGFQKTLGDKLDERGAMPAEHAALQDIARQAWLDEQVTRRAAGAFAVTSVTEMTAAPDQGGESAADIYNTWAMSGNLADYDQHMSD